MNTTFSVSRLRDGHDPALVFVNGFLNGSDDVPAEGDAIEDAFAEWLDPLQRRFPHNACYGVSWESGTKKDLGLFMADMAKQGRVSAIARNLKSNPWHQAYGNARQAGMALAAWIQQAEEASFILLGHSLGAKVVFHAMISLAKASVCDRIQDVYLLGGAVDNSASKWKEAVPAISGTLYNVFSRKDKVLRVLYRVAQAGTSSPVGYAGLEIPDWPRLANVDATPWVRGHSDYKEGLRVALGGLPAVTQAYAGSWPDLQIVGDNMTKDQNTDTSAYEKEFTDEGFWGKLKEAAKKVGCEGIRNALRLYYALDNPHMPMKVKAIIYGALGYFISPLDAIPDFIPVAGFSDDITILALAIGAAAMFITPEVKARADEKLAAWFGEGC